jgi:hypothetical protein
LTKAELATTLQEQDLYGIRLLNAAFTAFLATGGYASVNDVPKLL